jgi:hypothetical protein
MLGRTRPLALIAAFATLAAATPAMAAESTSDQIAALAKKVSSLQHKVSAQQRSITRLRRLRAPSEPHFPGDVYVGGNLIVRGKGGFGMTRIGPDQLGVVGGPINGDGSGLKKLNADELKTGTVPASVLTGLGLDKLTLPASQITGLDKLTLPSSQITGLEKLTLPSSQITGLDKLTLPASQIQGLAAIATSGSADDLVLGTLPSARLKGIYDQVVSFSNAGNAFTGDGAGVTSIPAGNVTGLASVATSGSASDLSSGTLPNGRLSGTYNNALAFTNAGNTLVGSGAGVTGVDAKYVSGYSLIGGDFMSDATGQLTITLPQNVFTRSFITLYDTNMNVIASVNHVGGVTFSGLTPNTKYIALGVGS